MNGTHDRGVENTPGHRFISPPLFEKHVPLTNKLPGLRKYEVSEGPIKSPVRSSDVYMVAILEFDSMTTIGDPFASEAERACAADRQQLAPDASSFQTFLFDTKEC
jgi:uncharacterized protein (TIGR02118 family)